MASANKKEKVESKDSTIAIDAPKEEKDVFKVVFKSLKRKHPKPDFRSVMDFSQISSNSNQFNDVSLTQLKPSAENDTLHCPECYSLGLLVHSSWKVFSINQAPGLLFLPNPFTPEGQYVWIKKCLEEYPEPPNPTNLSPLNSTKIIKDLWKSYKENSGIGKTTMMKLRWATLGYHHNWDTKIYDFNNYTKFPSCLEHLTSHVAERLNLSVKPEAAIVNYYHLDSTLGGHTDRSEKDYTAPLFSFSFGRTGIFMIGGRTKSVKPISMFVRSGDIIVMSLESRMSYHGVPKILPFNPDEENVYYTLNDKPIIEEDDFVLKYLKETRINLNVRQVFNSQK